MGIRKNKLVLAQVALGFMIVFLASCKHREGFKEIRDFKNHEWFLKDKQNFNFDIKNSDIKQNFSYLIRYDFNYPFYNLYLKQELLDQEGNVLSSSLDEVLLFDPKNGKPYGDGSNNVFETRIHAPKLQGVGLPMEGKYKWVVSHNMRPDPLKGIYSIGAEIVPATK